MHYWRQSSGAPMLFISERGNIPKALISRWLYNNVHNNNHLELSGNLNRIPLKLLHSVGDDLVNEVLVLLRQLGHHAQGERVVLVVQVWILDFIVKEAVSSRVIL